MTDDQTPEPTNRPSPDPLRYELFKTSCRPYPLDELAVYVAGVSLHQRRVYVDRRAEGYTWSFVHGGGPYPLLRTVAQFINYPYTKLVVGGREVGGTWCVLIGADNDDNPACEAWAVIDVEGGVIPEEAERLIRAALAC